MKLYNIEYEYKDISGVATVSASSPHKAAIILKSLGKFNGTPKVYSIYRIVETQEFKDTEGIISEVYKNPGTIVKESQATQIEPVIVTKVITEKVPVGVDINNLSKQDIERLRLKINEYTGTIYVDRIGAPKDSYGKLQEGYTVFITCTNNNLLNLFHIYRWDGEQFVDLGRPTKYRYVENLTKRVPLTNLWMLRGGTNDNYAKPDNYKYSLFIYKRGRCKSNKRWRWLRNLPAHIVHDKAQIRQYIREWYEHDLTDEQRSSKSKTTNRIHWVKWVFAVGRRNGFSHPKPVHSGADFIKLKYPTMVGSPLYTIQISKRY